VIREGALTVQARVYCYDLVSEMGCLMRKPVLLCITI